MFYSSIEPYANRWFKFQLPTTTGHIQRSIFSYRGYLLAFSHILNDFLRTLNTSPGLLKFLILTSEGVLWAHHSFQEKAI